MMSPRQGRGVEIQLRAHVQTSAFVQSDSNKGSEKDNNSALSEEYTLAIFFDFNYKFIPG